nr:hypothetical protein [Tanacetum cinerariifolium]
AQTCSANLFSNPLFDNDKINSDEINSHVESNSDESTSNHDIVKFDYLVEFYGPFIPNHILEEERIRREHTDYINRMEMLFTINPRPHPSTYANINVEIFFSLPIPIQESESHQEEMDVVTVTNDVLSLRVENENKIDFIDAGGIDFDSEEIENFLNDNLIPFGVEDSPFNMEEDILFLESLLIEDPIPPHPIIPNQTKFPIEEPKHSFKM